MITESLLKIQKSWWACDLESRAFIGKWELLLSVKKVTKSTSQITERVKFADRLSEPEKEDQDKPRDLERKKLGSCPRFHQRVKKQNPDRSR